MINRIQNRWEGFTTGDRIVLLLVEVAVFAICVSLLVASSPMGNDWQAVTAVVGFLFIGLQVVVLLIVLSFAASRRRKAATAAPTKSAKEKAASFGYGLLFWLALGLLYAAGGYAAEWMFPESELATKWRYSLDTDLEDAVYVFHKHPHDCEFLSAPIGSKHCHYDKEVTFIRVRNSQSGGRAVSYDDCKTWSPAEAGVRTTALVSWSKVHE